MSRVTYLLGAGASYGERTWNKNGEISEFTRGLPVVNEIERAVDLLIPYLHDSSDFYLEQTAHEYNLSLEQLKLVLDNLNMLKRACQSYPTIDTLAKQLYVTHSFYMPEENLKGINYDGLKRILSAVLLMLQDEKTRDLRYDGFIASLIDENRNFPPMTILSWNYDVQFELAYAGYAENGVYIPYQWDELNVFNKMYPTQFHPEYNFAMIKLNGTALFKDTHATKREVNGTYVDGIRDCFFGGSNMNIIERGHFYMSRPSCQTLLSYAWEDMNQAALEKAIEQRVYDTEELIVIGYSFPYVNNMMDSFILQSMQKLKKVIVQDLDDKFVDVKERIEAIMEGSNKKIEIVHKKNLQQFYIPNNFGEK